MTSDDGAVRVVDLQGRFVAASSLFLSDNLELNSTLFDVSRVRSTIAAHGVHPLTGVRNEMIRDVCVVVPKEDEGGKIQVVSCGFDQTVRVME